MREGSVESELFAHWEGKKETSFGGRTKSQMCHIAGRSLSLQHRRISEHEGRRRGVLPWRGKNNVNCSTDMKELTL